ncbi:PEP-CTERM sorting domain-containing protein [Aeoliella sp.]|uniref:PEP-CTERM sorting domain-containing protein n=1 Tax=Aeoliella sp. TaxID=2795800 RepID=UPI003CCBDD79
MLQARNQRPDARHSRDPVLLQRARFTVGSHTGSPLVQVPEPASSLLLLATVRIAATSLVQRKRHAFLSM